MTEQSLPEESIFLQAIAIASPHERAAFVAQACGTDAHLRAGVEALLRASAKSGDLLDVPDGFVATIDQPSLERVGMRLGRYRLLEQIGEGGMGMVWVAEQTEPVKRRVALKLIKPGMDTRQVLSRFEAERQALALMDHPNIAKVYDGGVTEERRPYFVMEYVKGVPITQFCDDARLSIRERLELFIPICQAVQSAHQKGVIHRDLKPSNILVCLYDGQPVPKVIDFGLAKAMHQPLTEHTLYTAHGLMVGTPLYMSPEQAEFNNLDVDTRSDVYSLGVILYELLTGSTPLEKRQLKDAALQEILRLIKEVDPQRPSMKLSTSVSLPSIAAQRSLEPAQLSRTVRGDLDWIVMKSLEKERSRRYETANGLARDIERYLSNEPIHARPPSTTYRLRKFAQRNRLTVAAVFVIAVSLLLGATISTWQAIRATAAERQSQANLESLQQVARQWATTETLTGDPKRAEAAIGLAEAAQVPREWTEILRAKSEMDQGYHSSAITRLAPIVADETRDGDGDTQLAALSLLTTSRAMNGDEHEYLKGLERIRKVKSEPGPESGLFKAVAESWTEPQKAMATLDAAEQKRFYPASLIIRANAMSYGAIQNRDQAWISEAVRDVKYAQLFAGNTQWVLEVKMVVHVNGLELAKILGDSKGVQMHSAEIATCIRQLETLPKSFSGVYFTAVGYQNLDQFEDAYEALRSLDWGSTHHIHWGAASVYEEAGEPQALLSKFEQFKFDEDNAHGLIARAHFLADISDRRNELSDIFQRVGKLRPDSMLARCYALDILALTGKPSQLQQEARLLLKQFGEQANYWGLLESLRYLSGEWNEGRVLKEVSSSISKQCVVHHFIGIQQLADGRKKTSRDHFRRCAATGVRLHFAYHWSKGYLARMADNPNWPDWIEEQP